MARKEGNTRDSKACISLPTASTELARGSQNQPPPALLKAQKLKFPEVGALLFETEIRLKVPAVFMASIGHHQIG